MQVVAVVPIFVSAGAAVLPAIIAAVASVVAVLFKPRELAAVCRRKPLMASGVAGGVILAIGGVSLWSQSPARASGAVARVTRTDWAKVAQDLIGQQSLHESASIPTASTQSVTPPAGIKTIEFSRIHYDGGPSPLQLKPLWNYRPEQTIFLSKPVFAPDGKKIFVAGCISDLGGYTGLLACLDADTGKPIWEKVELKGELLKPFFSSPAITTDGKNLIIGQGLHQDKDCALLCFDAATGDLRWAVKTPLHIESSPAIQGDMAVVGAGAIEGTDGRATGDPGFVFAVRISDGAKLWQEAVNDPESAPAIDPEGVTYIGSGFNGAAVVALRGESDAELTKKGLPRIAWKRPVAFPVTGPVTLIDDLVITGGGNSDLVHSNRNAKGQVIALRRETGEIAWQVTMDDSVLGPMAARGGMVLCPCRTGEVLALSLKDGEILWRSRISGNAPIVAGFALTDQRAYGLSTDGTLAILDIQKGAILEKLFVNDAAKPGSGLSSASPIVAAGRLIVASETGGVRALVGISGGK